ncbi:MAG: hypothetical protein KAR54_01725 [Candidatus Pacebacteria bacterium]|nr:hypothetical protein [Candidatus Paceibacterota bacterium]
MKKNDLFNHIKSILEKKDKETYILPIKLFPSTCQNIKEREDEYIKMTFGIGWVFSANRGKDIKFSKQKQKKK